MYRLLRCLSDSFAVFPGFAGGLAVLERVL